MLRKSLAVLLSAVALTFGAPVVGMAQGTVQQNVSLTGQVVDAGGRGVSSLPIEIVSNGLVVARTFSGPDGHFSVSGLAADRYVARTIVNGQPHGVRVTVSSANVAAALIVLPSVATAAPAVVAIVGLNGLVTTLTIAASVVAGEVVYSANQDGDQALLEETRSTAATYLAITASIANELDSNQAISLISSILGNVPAGATTIPAPITITIPGTTNTITITPASGTV